MRDTRTRGLLAAILLLAACGDEAAQAPAVDPASTVSPTPAGDPVVADWASRSWDLQSSGEGAALVFPGAGDAAIRLFCPADADRLLVNVPAFRPVGKTSAAPSPLDCRSQLREAQSATTGSPAGVGETVDAGSAAGASAASSPHAASSRVAARRPRVRVSRIALTPLAACSGRGTCAGRDCAAPLPTRRAPWHSGRDTLPGDLSCASPPPSPSPASRR